MLGMLRDHKGAQRVREYIREANKGHQGTLRDLKGRLQREPLREVNNVKGPKLG